MRLRINPENPKQAAVMSEDGTVLGWATNVQRYPDGSLTFENDWPAWKDGLPDLDGWEVIDV